MNNSPAMPQELSSQLAGPCASAGCCTSRPCGAGGERPGTARHSLAALTGTEQPAAAGHRARSPRITTRRDRVARAAGPRGLRRDPLPAWRKARERAWKRDGNTYSAHSWPGRIAEGELAAVLLMQSHGGHGEGNRPRSRPQGSRTASPPAGTTSSIRTNRSRWPSWSAGSNSHSLMSATPRCSRRRSST